MVFRGWGKRLVWSHYASASEDLRPLGGAPERVGGSCPSRRLVGAPSAGHTRLGPAWPRGSWSLHKAHRALAWMAEALEGPWERQKAGTGWGCCPQGSEGTCSSWSATPPPELKVQDVVFHRLGLRLLGTRERREVAQPLPAPAWQQGLCIDTESGGRGRAGRGGS